MSLVHIDTSDFDEAHYPIPPQSFMSAREVCVHTPCPQGYNQWHEWARAASKTHRQIRCPRCGKWSIWLPKAIARAINQKQERESREFAKQYRKAFALERIAELQNELSNQ